MYTKAETDTSLNNKANKSDVYTKSETDNKINEPLYNLGYYDTITANSDGTYTITRQTGYLVLDGVVDKFDSKNSTPYNSVFTYSNDKFKSTITNPSNSSTISNIICNRFETQIIDYIYYNNVYGIGIYTNGEIWVGLTTSVSTLEDANAYLIQNPISIQYKLATSYTEKVEKNHYATYNQRFILEHNRNEAERSANVFNIDDINPNKTPYVKKISDTEFKATWAGYVLFKTNFKENTQYTISGYTKEDNATHGGRLKIFYTDNTSEECLINYQTSYVYRTHTSQANKTINYIGYSYETGDYYSYYRNLMINEGTTPLPYQPYEGKVVHEKELESITPGIFTKLGNKTNFSFDSGSYLVVANNGMVTVTGTDPLNVGSSANKKFVGIFMVTIAEYGGGQSVCVNTEEVFLGEAASATISGPTFTIYRLN